MHFLIFFLLNLFICSMFCILFFVPFLHILNLIKCFKPEIFKSISNKFKSCQCFWFYTLLLHFGTRAYLFSPDEGSCYVFSTRNICCVFLADCGVTFQSVIKSKIKTIKFKNKEENDCLY